MKKKATSLIRTRVTTVTCPSCKDEIFSRARHDFKRCKCGEIAVDGGDSYLKICFKQEMPKCRHRYVKATRNELYQDWNNRDDKFGKIEK